VGRRVCEWDALARHGKQKGLNDEADCVPMQNKFKEVLVVLLRALGFHNLGVYLGLVGGLPPMVGCLDVLCYW
jgi:hypothetical protein